MEENCVKKEIPSDNDQEEEEALEEKVFLAGHFKIDPLSDHHCEDGQKDKFKLEAECSSGEQSALQDPEFIVPDLLPDCPVEQEMCREDEECPSEDTQLSVVEPVISLSEFFEVSSPVDSNLDENEDDTPVSHESRGKSRGSAKRSRSSASSENSTKRSTPASAMRKQLKNSGLPYVSSRGKPMEGAKMRHPCACSMDCVHKLSEENRKKVFAAFWKLGDHNMQWDFIRNNSVSSKTKSGLKRSVHRSYFFIVDGEKIPVCKFMFMSTLGICDSWITSAYSHVNPEGNTVSPERRGRHKNHSAAYTEAKIQTVEQHLSSLPRVSPHYCRQRSYREYLEHGLSVALLARIYSKWAVEQGFHKSQIATRRQYIDIVNAHFNVSFFNPRKDRCKLCLIVTNKKTSQSVLDRYQAIYSAHIQNKKRARDLKEKDKKDGVNNSKVAVLSLGLEKQLNCPKSEDRQFYYVRKLNLYNCTFFNMIKRMGLCVLWHEGIGRKGSNEIASAVLYYVKKLHEEGYQDFRLWSDNCAGQNKNRFLFAMYVYLCVLLKVKITHRYFEPGHTQTECDLIHARIEKASEKKELYDFEEWLQLIENTKCESPKYEVTRLDSSSFVCFRSLVSQQNWEKDAKGNLIKWSKVKEIAVDGDGDGKEGLVKLKYNLFDDNYITLNVNKLGNDVDLETYRPPKAYQAAIPIPVRTKQDLESLLNVNSIPESYQNFYKDVLERTVPTEEEGSEMDYETDEELCEGEVLLDEMDELRGTEENQGGDEEEPVEE